MPSVKEISEMEIGTTYKDRISDFTDGEPKAGKEFHVKYVGANPPGCLDGLPDYASITTVVIKKVGKETITLEVKKRLKGKDATDCKTADYSGMFSGNVCPHYETPCNIRKAEFCPY